MASARAASGSRTATSRSRTRCTRSTSARSGMATGLSRSRPTRRSPVPRPLRGTYRVSGLPVVDAQDCPLSASSPNRDRALAAQRREFEHRRATHEAMTAMPLARRSTPRATTPPRCLRSTRSSSSPLVDDAGRLRGLITPAYRRLQSEQYPDATRRTREGRLVVGAATGSSATRGARWPSSTRACGRCSQVDTANGHARLMLDMRRPRPTRRRAAGPGHRR